MIKSVNLFHNQVLLQSFLITYICAATDQKLFIFGMGVPGRVLFHSTSMDPWVMPQGGARGKNLGHPNKVVYLSKAVLTSTTIYVLSRNMKNVKNFLSEIFQFLEVKYYIYLNRRVFAMMTNSAAR